MKTISEIKSPAFAVLIGMVWLMACATGGPVFSQMPADSLLAYGLGRLEARKWDDAAQALQQFTFQYPAHDRYQEARFRLGDAYFGKKEYITAVAEYSRLATDFPTGQYADDARFKVCESYAQLSPKPQLDQEYTQAAIDHCESLLAYFPDSPLAPQAQEIAGEMRDKLAEKLYMTGVFYYKLRAYDSALKYFDDTVRTYPNASVMPKVLFRMWESYRELGYAEEAQSTRERLIREFPTSEEAKRIQVVSVADGG